VRVIAEQLFKPLPPRGVTNSGFRTGSQWALAPRFWRSAAGGSVGADDDQARPNPLPQQIVQKAGRDAARPQGARGLRQDSSTIVNEPADGRHPAARQCCHMLLRHHPRSPITRSSLLFDILSRPMRETNAPFMIEPMLREKLCPCAVRQPG